LKEALSFIPMRLQEVSPVSPVADRNAGRRRCGLEVVGGEDDSERRATTVLTTLIASMSPPDGIEEGK